MTCAQETMVRWGIPDWSDPSTYGDASRWSGSRWRWEFTRRRPDYRADFEKYAQGTLDRLDERRRTEPTKKFLGRNDPGFVATMEWMENYDAMELVEKYGLLHLPNPCISDQPWHVIRFEKRFGGVMRGDGPFRWNPNQQAEKETATMLVPEGAAAALFDLSRPLNPQLKTAKEILIELQKVRKEKTGRKPHRQKWLNYLRALDARESNATLAEMGSVFWPDTFLSSGNARKNEHSAWDEYQAAVRLRDNLPT
jgi:hypothetical protein